MSNDSSTNRKFELFVVSVTDNETYEMMLNDIKNIYAAVLSNSLCISHALLADGSVAPVLCVHYDVHDDVHDKSGTRKLLPIARLLTRSEYPMYRVPSVTYSRDAETNKRKYSDNVNLEGANEVLNFVIKFAMPSANDSPASVASSVASPSYKLVDDGEDGDSSDDSSDYEIVFTPDDSASANG